MESRTEFLYPTRRIQGELVGLGIKLAASTVWTILKRGTVQVGSVRRECLDRILILGRRHLESVIKTYTRHYNEHRPHRSLGQRSPLRKQPLGEHGMTEPIDLDRVSRRDLLGGLIHDYRLAA